jgi:hypothetical protein
MLSCPVFWTNYAGFFNRRFLFFSMAILRLRMGEDGTTLKDATGERRDLSPSVKPRGFKEDLPKEERMPKTIVSNRGLVLLPIILLLLMACSLTGEGSPAAHASPTATGKGGLPTKTGGHPAETAEPSDTTAPTPTYTIVHLSTPQNVTGTTRYITDFDTKPYAPQKKAIGGDEYYNNRWERPFTSEEMEYLSDVDLKRVDLRLESPWVYVTFEFLDPRAEGIGQTMYGAEFDLNKDGRGEFLIWGASPPSGEWTTDGVEVWQDTNFDVGGPTPQGADAPWDKGDGYDKNLFAGGVGDDPDLAWIRQLEEGKKVELAFKYSVINNAAQFLWNGLADLGVRNPAWLDYNDHFIQKDAGSPLPVQTTLYPLKDLWGVDNTCRDAFGYTPTGSEPGLCLYTGTISGKVFRDQAPGNPPSTVDNGILDANEPGLAEGGVHLGQGACPSSGYKDAAPNGNGDYAFQGIVIGKYCVSFTYVYPDPYHFLTTPTSVTVTLAPNGHEVVNFGVDWTEPPEIPEVPK